MTSTRAANAVQLLAFIVWAWTTFVFIFLRGNGPAEATPAQPRPPALSPYLSPYDASAPSPVGRLLGFDQAYQTPPPTSPPVSNTSTPSLAEDACFVLLSIIAITVINLAGASMMRNTSYWENFVFTFSTALVTMFIVASAVTGAVFFDIIASPTTRLVVTCVANAVAFWFMGPGKDLPTIIVRGSWELGRIVLSNTYHNYSGSQPPWLREVMAISIISHIIGSTLVVAASHYGWPLWIQCGLFTLTLVARLIYFLWNKLPTSNQLSTRAREKAWIICEYSRPLPTEVNNAMCHVPTDQALMRTAHGKLSQKFPVLWAEHRSAKVETA